MASTVARNVGVDISKDTLDVAIHPEGRGFRIANTPEGHRALIKGLEGFEIARIVFEATGAYHRLLQRALVEAGLPWVKVNPRQARRFAQAAGKLAKTDRCDALMLARMGAALELEPNLPVSPTVETMKELVNARHALVKDRVAGLNRQAVAVSTLIKRQLAQRLRQIDSQIEAIDKRLKTLRKADAEVSQRFDILTSIPSFGEGTANVLMVETPELGVSTISRPQVWSASPRSQTTADRPAANDPFAAVGHGPGKPSIWPPSAPSGSIPSSKPNTRP